VTRVDVDDPVFPILGPGVEARFDGGVDGKGGVGYLSDQQDVRSFRMPRRVGPQVVTGDHDIWLGHAALALIAGSFGGQLHANTPQAEYLGQ